MHRIALALASTVLFSACAGHGASDPKPMTVSFSFTVAAGEEKTQCFVTRLDNVKNFDFSRIDSHMAPGSHHLILYRDASSLMPGSTAPTEGVGDCDMGAARLFVYTTQEADHFIEMPPHVAGQLGPNELVILEAHYVNASTQPMTASAEVTLTPAVPGTVTDYSGIIFYLDTNFSVPPGAGISGAPAYTHSTTCAVPEGIHIFRLGSHTHKRGVDVKIFQNSMAVGTSGDLSMVYENTDWSKPKELDFADGAPLDIGANQGFRFTCSWTNETAAPIQFGESVQDEMCIIGAGYWPRVSGPQALGGNVVCLDGTLYY